MPRLTLSTITLLRASDALRAATARLEPKKLGDPDYSLWQQVMLASAELAAAMDREALAEPAHEEA